MSVHEKINIRPQVNILSVLKFLEYETWYALAEFVDNSIQSYSEYVDELKKVEGEDYVLKVEIEINQEENSITIKDNAAGINELNFARAFRAAEVPTDSSGLSEFGMGMKSAACWFSDHWTVVTKPLYETTEKTVVFDMNHIYEDKIEELDVTSKEKDSNEHYTVIKLNGVTKMPRRRGLGKVKEHLKGIYREFLRAGNIEIYVDSEKLEYKEPKILNAPLYSKPDSESILWRKEVELSINDKMRVHGFVGIREKGSTSQAGLALFRRGRVIEGSFDTGFRPDYIFGNPNSFRYQRVFGELHLEGFDVSFTKKGIQWDENLEAFLKLLRDDLSHIDFPLLQQAENYRIRATAKEYKKVQSALDRTSKDIEEKFKQIIETTSTLTEEEHEEENLPEVEEKIHRSFEIRHNKVNWIIHIELSYDPALSKMIEVGNHLLGDVKQGTKTRHVGIRLSLTHPFMVEFAGVDIGKIEPILRVMAALSLSEVIAKESGAKTQGEIRRNFNEIISHLTKTQ